MTPCPICQHAKRQAIDEALSRGRLAGVVATQYRVKKLDLIAHLKHAPIQAVTTTLLSHTAASDGLVTYRDGGFVTSPMRPLALVQQGWQAATGDQAERARIVQWLNDQLQADEMGL